MFDVLLANMGARLRETSLWWREASGDIYPTAAHKRDRWAIPPPKRDSLARLLRFRARLAADHERSQA